MPLGREVFFSGSFVRRAVAEIPTPRAAKLFSNSHELVVKHGVAAENLPMSLMAENFGRTSNKIYIVRVCTALAALSTHSRVGKIVRAS